MAAIPSEILFELHVVTYVHVGSSALTNCTLANRQIHEIITSTPFVVACLTRSQRNRHRPPLEGLWDHMRFALRQDVVDALYAASLPLSTYTIDQTLGRLKMCRRILGTKQDGIAYTQAYCRMLSRVVQDHPTYIIPDRYNDILDTLADAIQYKHISTAKAIQEENQIPHQALKLYVDASKSPLFWEIFGPTMTSAAEVIRCYHYFRYRDLVPDVTMRLTDCLWMSLRDEVKVELQSGSLVQHFNSLTSREYRIATTLAFYGKVTLPLTDHEKHEAAWDSLDVGTINFVTLAEDGWFNSAVAEAARSDAYVENLFRYCWNHRDQAERVIVAIQPSQTLLRKLATQRHQHRRHIIPAIISAAHRERIHVEEAALMKQLEDAHEDHDNGAV